MHLQGLVVVAKQPWRQAICSARPCDLIQSRGGAGGVWQGRRGRGGAWEEGRELLVCFP